MKSNIGAIITEDGFKALAIADEQFHRFDHTVEAPKVHGLVTGVISDAQCFSRSFKLPPVEEKKIPDIMRFEASQQIPFEMDDVEWDYCVHEDDFSPDWLATMIAARKDLIRRVQEVYDRHGIAIDCLVPSYIALWNLVKKSGIRDTVALIYPQFQSVTVSVYSDGCVWQRCLPLEVSTEPNSICDLIAEVQRSLRFYNSTNRDSRVTCGFTIGMPQEVTKALDSVFVKEGIPIEPWKIETGPVEDVNEAILVGLALHKRDMSLLPKRKLNWPHLPSLPEAGWHPWKNIALTWFTVAMCLLLINILSRIFLKS
jgi:hypothetical protein